MLFDTTAAYFEEVLAESFTKTVILDFYAPWCAPCRALAPELDALSDRLEASVSAYSVNIDKETELVQKFGIKTLPTVLVLKNGEVRTCFEKDVSADLIGQAVLMGDK
ncbi:MAG: thioredoxin fold domain-containing protein [Oscillospiraceae bacterium]|nr:thioredoxin fold domain-containing protein [Oscillospiraceae bacterium]